MKGTLHFEHSQRVGMLELSGDLDISVQDRLRDLVDQVLAAEIDGVVVDLSGLRFTDMTGVNALVSLATRTQPHGVRVVLMGAPKLLDRLLRLLDLYEAFDHASTRESALWRAGMADAGATAFSPSVRYADPGSAP